MGVVGGYRGRCLLTIACAALTEPVMGTGQSARRARLQPPVGSHYNSYSTNMSKYPNAEPSVAVATEGPAHR